jgi:hypothetical protein
MFSETECKVKRASLPQVESNWFIWESVVRRCNGYRSDTCSFNLGLEIPETRHQFISSL